MSTSDCPWCAKVIRVVGNVFLDHHAFAIGVLEDLRLEIDEIGAKLCNHGREVAMAFPCLVLLRLELLDLVPLAVSALCGCYPVAFQHPLALLPVGHGGVGAHGVTIVAQGELLPRTASTSSCGMGG
jgi:hypothetical protein